MDKRRWFSILVAGLVLAGTFSFTGSTLRAQGDSRTFPETGKTVKTRFLAYWNAHGALAQQGYPITEEAQEQSDTDGKTYTVQYFQRAVFEYHPEFASTPSEVLLSLLGVFYYNDKHGGNAPGQKVSTDSPRQFAETGKTIGGAFRQYWEAHGGLAQQGYPISEEFQEVDKDGVTRIVQYFQRAVFEFHQEFAGTPNQVLLSLLGVSYNDKKKGGGGTPPAPPAPGQPTATATPVPPQPQPVDNTGQVVFYNKQTGKSVIGRVDASGNYADLKAYTTWATNWSQIVPLGQGYIFFYNTTSGLTTLGRVTDDGTYTDVQSSLSLGPGWTNVVPAGNNLILFYKAGSNSGGIARVNPNGSISILKVYTTFYADWTNVTGLDNGVVIFYQTSTGLVSALSVDSDGNLINQKQYNKVKFSDRVVPSIDGRVLFYRYQNGEAVAARFDQASNFIGLMTYPSEGPPMPNPFPTVAGMSNGTLLFYNSGEKSGVTARLSGDGSVPIYNRYPAGSFGDWSLVVGIR